MRQPVQLFHGTTLRAAEQIRRTGWRSSDPREAVTAEALRLDADPDAVWEEMVAEPQCYVTTPCRGQFASFALSFESAAHGWAQRAPEIRREVLWAVWRLANPDRARTWPQHVDGHAWVLDKMSDDQPAVLAVTVEYDQLLAAGGMTGGFKNTLLDPYEWLVDPHVSIPEVAVPLPLQLNLSKSEITSVPRQVDWDVYMHWLGVSIEEFRVLDESGALGQRGARDERLMPLRGSRPWWPLDTVDRVLAERAAAQARGELELDVAVVAGWRDADNLVQRDEHGVAAEARTDHEHPVDDFAGP